MPKHRLFIYFILLTCLLIFFGGCSARKKPAPGLEDHEVLLERGLSQLKAHNLQNALKTLETVKARYPYTNSAIIAGLKLADTYFESGEYEMAFDLYEEFERFHPKDPNTPYVMYQKGMCHFERIRSFDREQTNIIKAREMFERLIKKYPDNEYSNKARKKLRTCFSYLARYEVYVGNFYFRQGKYNSAIQRYTYAIKNYPDMGQYHEALEKMSSCKQKLAEMKKSSEEIKE